MLHIHEPPDGTRLAVHHGDGEWRIIWRDDAAANYWCGFTQPERRWWNSVSSVVPTTLADQTKGAEAVHLLGEQVTIGEQAPAPRSDKHSFSGSVRRVGGELVDVDECSRPAPLFSGDVRSCRRPAADPIHS